MIIMQKLNIYIKDHIRFVFGIISCKGVSFHVKKKKTTLLASTQPLSSSYSKRAVDMHVAAAL